MDLQLSEWIVTVEFNDYHDLAQDIFTKTNKTKQTTTITATTKNEVVELGVLWKKWQD